MYLPGDVNIGGHASMRAHDALGHAGGTGRTKDSCHDFIRIVIGCLK